MKTLLGTLLIVLVGAPSLANAAPTPTPRATATPVATPAPFLATPDPTPAPEDAVVMPVARFVAGEGDPNDKTVGVGAGWVFPADLLTPNTVSVRFRLASGLTIEPLANASFSQSFTHQHLAVSGGGSAAARDYTANLAFAVQVRKPLKRRGPVELHLLVTPGVSFTDTVDNPSGVQDRVFETSTVWALGWGLGVEYFPPKLEQHWSVSMDATNPLFGFGYNTNYDQATRVRTNTTAYSLGATFAPAVRGMVHLYY